MIIREKPCITTLSEGNDGLSAALSSWMFSMCLAGLGYQTILIQTDTSPIQFDPDTGIRHQLTQHLHATCMPTLQTLVLPIENTSNRNQQFESFIRSIRTLPAEYIIMDLGTAKTEFDHIAMAFADIPVYLMTDEPASVIKAYHLIRSTLLTKLKFYIDDTEVYQRFQQCGVLRDGPFLNTLSNCMEKLKDIDPWIHDKIQKCKTDFSPHTVVLNNTVQYDYQQLLCSAVQEYLDLSLNCWGSMCDKSHWGQPARMTFNSSLARYNSKVVSMVIRHILAETSESVSHGRYHKDTFRHIFTHDNTVKHHEMISLN
ncbi:MAG: hypothetical protein U5R06_16250 [candidate division KSB1 bacterium]|nr:hypothetical protein [candidate division KSB1 bacterium]